MPDICQATAAVPLPEAKLQLIPALFDRQKPTAANGYDFGNIDDFMHTLATGH